MAIISLRAGDDLPLRISFFDENDDNAPVDMTDWTVTATVTTGDCGSDVDLTFEWIDALQGVGRVLLSEEETTTLDYPAEYSLNVTATSPDGMTTSAKPVKIAVRG